jgi:hypothetical protein
MILAFTAIAAAEREANAVRVMLARCRHLLGGLAGGERGDGLRRPCAVQAHNNLPAPINLTENPYDKKHFCKDASQKSARVVP